MGLCCGRNARESPDSTGRKWRLGEGVGVGTERTGPGQWGADPGPGRCGRHTVGRERNPPHSEVGRPAPARRATPPRTPPRAQPRSPAPRGPAQAGFSPC